MTCIFVEAGLVPGSPFTLITYNNVGYNSKVGQCNRKCISSSISFNVQNSQIRALCLRPIHVLPLSELSGSDFHYFIQSNSDNKYNNVVDLSALTLHNSSKIIGPLHFLVLKNTGDCLICVDMCFEMCLNCSECQILTKCIL